MNSENNFFTAIRTCLRGVGQVMFQQSAWTGLFFLAGIFWGSYATNNPAVAYGAIVGCLSATIAGFLVHGNTTECRSGLWGFNGTLVGCAFPTFLANTWLMWIALVFCAMCTTWVRHGLNNIMAQWKINSLTFPFVLMTWIFLLVSRMSEAMPAAALSTPEIDSSFHLLSEASFGDLVIYWLKGISQVFLVNSWVTGIFFIVALALCSRWAAFWAMAASAISLAISCLFHFSGSDISNGLLGFSPVLTGIAVGMTFYKPNWRSALWAVAAIIATVFIQVAMDMFLMPFGIPTLTGPFCITTWLFLSPLYKFDGSNDSEKADYSEWDKDVINELHKIENKIEGK